MPEKIWQVKNSESDEGIGELLIMGDVSDEEWFEDDVTPQKIMEDLESLGDIEELKVKINSRGGSVFSGISISNIIQDYADENDVEVTAYVLGLAASIASVIATTLPNLVMYPNSMLMIHNPFVMLMGGTSEDLRKAADDLDSIRESLIITYQRKTNLPRQQIIDMLNEETWLTSDEALEYGFADDVKDDVSMAASLEENKLIMNGAEFDLSSAKLNPPKEKLNIDKKDNGEGGAESSKQSTPQDDNETKEKETENKGSDMMSYKNFETEEEFQNFLDEKRKGYIKFEDIVDNFDFEVESVKDISDKIKGLENELENKKEELNEIKNDKLFNERKTELAKYDVEVTKEEDYEDILDYSDKQFEKWVDSLKKVTEKMEEKENKNFKRNQGDFDPNAFIDDNPDIEENDIVNQFK
ncbi:MAG: head maturation protease, ClpP-related [Bacillota bacterium]